MGWIIKKTAFILLIASGTILPIFAFIAFGFTLFFYVILSTISTLGIDDVNILDQIKFPIIITILLFIISGVLIFVNIKQRRSTPGWIVSLIANFVIISYIFLLLSPLGHFFLITWIFNLGYCHENIKPKVIEYLLRNGDQEIKEKTLSSFNKFCEAASELGFNRE